MNTAVKTITAVLVTIVVAVALQLTVGHTVKPVHRELACTAAAQCAHLQQTHPGVEVIYYPKAKAA